MEFGNPKILLLIWLTPLVALWWIWAIRQREAALATFVSPHMQEKLAPKRSGMRIRLQIALLIAGFFFSVVALSRPQWGEREETVYQRGRDVIIALDVSRSMLADDVHPNRLSRAKIDLIDLIQELRGDRAGLLAFRRNAQLVCPLTTDYAFLRHALEGCGLHSAAAGETDIGSAIHKAIASFDNDLGAHKIIVLISDGEDLEGAAISAAEEAAERGIVIFTVGLGSDAGSRIPNADDSNTFMQHDGSVVMTRLQNETLDQIASITGGAYAPIATASTASHTLGDLYRQHLVNVSAQDLEETLLRRRVERFQWFLLPALLCFLAAGFLSRGRLATSAQSPSTPPSIPAQGHGLAVLLLLVLPGLCTTAVAQTNAPGEPIVLKEIPPGRSGARIAQGQYAKGDFAEAAQTYLAASKGATRDSAFIFEYNAAICYFEAGEYSTAKDILARLAQSAEGDDAAQVNRALGLAAYKTAQEPPPPPDDSGEDATDVPTRSALLQEAGEAFRRAARERDPQNESSENLAITLNELESVQEEERINTLMEKYQKSTPGQMAAEMLANQRRIQAGIASASTNMRPSRISEFEALAKLQEDTADLWVPLKQRIMEAASQNQSDDAQQQLAQLNQQIESTRHNMLDASEQLEDLRLESKDLAKNSEVSVYQLWKMVAPHDLVLQEELRQQSNCVNWISSPESAPIQDKRFLGAAQTEARSLSELFRERFEQAMAQQQQAPAPAAPQAGPGADDQAGGLDDETIKKIKELLELAATSQDETLKSLERPESSPAAYSARAAYQYLKEIDDLLPKQQPQSDSQQQQDQQEQQDSDQQQEPQENENQDEDQNADQQEPEEPPPPEEDPQSGSETNETADASPPPEDMLPEDVEKLLERALRREKEHEQKRREKLNRIPLAPMKRDW